MLSNADRIRLKTANCGSPVSGRNNLLLFPTGERTLDLLEGAIAILHGAAVRLSVEVAVESSHASTLLLRRGPGGGAREDPLADGVTEVGHDSGPTAKRGSHLRGQSLGVTYP